MKSYTKWFLLSIILLTPFTALAYGRHSHYHTHNAPTPPVQTPTSPVVPPSTPTENESVITAYLTSYQSGDNTPAGSTGTYIDGISGNAGGIGTYANPITMAVGYVGDVADYAAGTMFYVPQLEKYFTAGDTCTSCHKGYQGHVWMDMYSGNYSSQAGLACEDAITADYTVDINPPSNLSVNTTPLFNGSACIL